MVGFALLAGAGRGTLAAQPSSNVDDYFAFSFRRMLLKDFHLEAPGCNLGVNCPETGRTCGRLSMSGAVVPAPGQLAGDNVCGPGSFYQVFRNNLGAYCSPSCSMISNPGSGPKCENPFTVPILGDLDQDGQASCDGNCTVDLGDVAAACGVPHPFPACDPSRGVMAPENSDCLPASLDVVPHNGRCDLAAGTYGMIRVRNRGRINFGAGTTVTCTLAVAKAARVTSSGPALVVIPGNGWASFGNLSDVGGSCREFKVVTELGPLRFGKHGEFHLDACSLGGTMRLGHDNNLRGRFVSGEFIISNYNNTGGCCEGPSTTTTTVSSTTTITSASSTTSTSIPGPVCCQDSSQEPSQCGSAASTAACLESGGLPGPAGSVCEDDGEGGGRCSDAPSNPGGCCQFEGSCAIGGGLDDAICSSLGGAFVPDTICSPEGNCIAVTTSTTTATTLPPTSSTILPTTTVTLTTSTTSTTTPSGPVCCDVPGAPPLCISAASASACAERGGAPGPVDSTCQGAPGGGGSCQTGPPDDPAGCCQFDGSCAIGGELDEAGCTSLGGAFVTDAICTVDGQCESSGGTTSTTLGTVTTTTFVPPTTSSSVPTTTLVSTTVTSVSTTATSVSTTATSVSTSVTSSTVDTTSSTAVSSSSSTVTTATSVSSTSNTSVTATSTTVQTTSTTNTTIPGGGAFTRTLGFYKTHPGVTQWILDGVGGVTVCGVHIDNTDYDDAHSALEALCISPQGDGRLQLVRQLTAAALTMAAGGATYTNFTACDTLCASGGGSVTDIGNCINATDNFNNSGDNLPAPFDGFESGSPEYCRIAHTTDCTVLDPTACQQ